MIMSRFAAKPGSILAITEPRRTIHLSPSTSIQGTMAEMVDIVSHRSYDPVIRHRVELQLESLLHHQAMT